MRPSLPPPRDPRRWGEVTTGKRGEEYGIRRLPSSLSFLLPILIAGIFLLLNQGFCLAADIQPPTEQDAKEFARGSTLAEKGWAVNEYVRMHKITEQNGETEVYYYLYVVYTATLPDAEDPETYHAHAAYETGIWKGSAEGPAIYQSGYYGAPYRAAESMAEALSALDGAMQEAFKTSGVKPGWPVLSTDGSVISPGDGGYAGTDRGKRIPVPGSWWTWLTGTVAAGIIAAIAGFLNSLLTPPTVPVSPPKSPPGKGAVKPPQPPPAGKKPRRQGGDVPRSLFDFPPGMEPFPADIAAGTADPFDLQKYPNQPGYIGDAVHENLTAAMDAVGPTLVDSGAALKDGVIGFVKGIASIPVVALEGYVEIGRLLATAHTEATEGGPGVFSDMVSPSVGWDTLKNIFGPLGKEVLPIDELKSLFDSNASLEEQLWAIPSAAVKLANLIMMSEKLATKAVPGLDPNFTFIKSAKPGLAIEAAVKGTDPGVQKQYETYKKAGEAKAAGIKDSVDKGGKVSKEQVLDAMSDPATMRNIKKAPEAVQKEFNLTQTKEVYQPVYDDMVEYMKGKDPSGTYRVGGVRTPGQKSLINTDNDAIVEKLTYTRDGKPYWKEVPAHEWEGAYYDSFSRRTGFTPEKAKARFPEKDWDRMTPMEQKKAWTEGHGQECMDVKNPEAAQSFSNQPTVMDPKWKPGGKSPVADGRIVDGEGLYNMEKYKTTRGWKGEGTTVKSQTEAMEQGAKLCNLSKKMAAQSMQRTGKAVRYPEAFKQGEAILKRNDLPPAVRDQALKNIGFKGGYEEFMEKLSSWTGRLP